MMADVRGRSIDQVYGLATSRIVCQMIRRLLRCVVHLSARNYCVQLSVQPKGLSNRCKASVSVSEASRGLAVAHYKTSFPREVLPVIPSLDTHRCGIANDHALTEHNSQTSIVASYNTSKRVLAGASRATMTTTFPSLQPPIQDDTMEMSSPARYDDIEIDFDEQSGAVNLALTDDERMMEDGDQTRPPTATDLEMMEDDAHAHDVQMHEGHMVESLDAGQYEALDPDMDDELIDYDDDEYAEMTLVEQQDDNAGPEPVAYTAQSEGILEALQDNGAGLATIDEYDEGTTVWDQDAITDGERVETVDPQHDVYVEADAPLTATDMPPSAFDDQAPVIPVAFEALAQDPASQSETAEALGHTDVLDFGGSADDQTTHQQMTVLEAEHGNTDMPGTPTDTGLHPMSIRYADYEWPLFKSRKQPEGLLKDDNLVNLSLADFLSNCRQRIAIKLGEDVSEEQEYVLAFDSLGVFVTEVCRLYISQLCIHNADTWQSSNACGSTTLNEVLEVYTHLCANDDMNDAPPLSLTLSLQLKFPSHLHMLRDAAARGEGISAFVDQIADQNVEDEYADYYGDGADLDDDAAENDVHHTGDEEYAHDPENEEIHAVDATDIAQLTSKAADTKGDAIAHGVQNLNGSGQTQNYLVDEVAQDHHQDTEVNGPSSHAADEQTTAIEQAQDVAGPSVDIDEPSDAAVLKTTTVLPQEDLEAGPEAPEAEGVEAENLESGASSTTLHADHAEEDVGKYSDEDSIDWDEEHSLTTSISESGIEGHFKAPTDVTGPDDDGALEGDPGGIDPFEQFAKADDDLDDTASHDFGEDETQDPVEESADLDPADVYNSVADEVEHEAAEADNVTSSGVLEPSDVEDADTTLEFQNFEEGAAANNNSRELLADDLIDDSNTAPQPTKATDLHAHIPGHDLDDNIDFDDDTVEQHEARKAANGRGSPSPLGKRSFHETECLYDDGEPTPKKARAS